MVNNSPEIIHSPKDVLSAGEIDASSLLKPLTLTDQKKYWACVIIQGGLMLGTFVGALKIAENLYPALNNSDMIGEKLALIAISTVGATALGLILGRKMKKLINYS